MYLPFHGETDCLVMCHVKNFLHCLVTCCLTADAQEDTQVCYKPLCVRDIFSFSRELLYVSSILLEQLSTLL